MSERKYTEGPWTAVDHDGEGWWTVLRGAWDISHNQARNPRVVADAKYSAMTAEENEANAHLIASAPDLLESLDPESLESVADEIEFHFGGEAEGLRNLATKQRAAMKKALGEDK